MLAPLEAETVFEDSRPSVDTDQCKTCRKHNLWSCIYFFRKRPSYFDVGWLTTWPQALAMNPLRCCLQSWSPPLLSKCSAGPRGSAHTLTEQLPSTYSQNQPFHGDPHLAPRRHSKCPKDEELSLPTPPQGSHLETTEVQLCSKLGLHQEHEVSYAT